MKAPLLAVFLAATAALLSAGPVTVAWNYDLTETGVWKGGGFRIHLGRASANYTDHIDIPADGLTQVPAGEGTVSVGWRIEGLTSGATYFSAVTAYAGSGLESEMSNEISFTVLPSKPTDLRVGIEVSEDLQSWELIKEVTLTTGETARFYRLRIIQPPQ